MQNDCEGGLQKQDTLAQIEEQKKKGMTGAASGLLCCSWLPMVGFWAAENMLPTCETRLDSYLRMYTLYFVIIGPLKGIIATAAAYTDNKKLFKFVMSVVSTTTFGIGTYLLGSGWVLYSKTTDANCYDGDGDPKLDHYINPRQMIFVILLVHSIVFGLVIVCMSFIVLAAMNQAEEKEAPTTTNRRAPPVSLGVARVPGRV